MINPTEPNIWDRLLDILSFYQSGNFKRFDSCFKRVLESLNINLESVEQYSRLRSRYFRTARVLGFLELSPTSSESHWSLNPPALLKIPDGYILIAPPNIAAKVPEVLNRFKDHDFTIFCEDKGIRNYCRVTLKKTKALSYSLKQSLQDQNICTVEDIGKKILNKLPPIETVYKSCLEDTLTMLPEYYDEAEIFLFDEFEWVSAKPFDYFSSALLRKKNMFYDVF